LYSLNDCDLILDFHRAQFVVELMPEFLALEAGAARVDLHHNEVSLARQVRVPVDAPLLGDELRAGRRVPEEKSQG
jgi:hypothetical protein